MGNKIKKSLKIWFIVGASLATLGTILFVTVFAIAGWDFNKLSDNPLETNAYSFTEEITSISISAYTSDVSIVPSSENETRVECLESSNEKYLVSVKNGILTVTADPHVSWYDLITFFSVGSPKITVYLPENEYKALNIKSSTSDVSVSKDFKFESIDISVGAGSITCNASASGCVKLTASTGDITLSNASAGSAELKTSTGDITVSNLTDVGSFKVIVGTGDSVLTNVTCTDFTSTGTSGSIEMNNLIASGSMSIERNTGDVSFDRCDAKSIKVRTSTGDVTGSLISDKSFFTKSSTGNIIVPQTVSEEICEIKTSTGDIILTIAQ